MADLFTLENFFTLLMLVLLQAVLGFDNLLYISLESQRAPEADRARVRRIGIGLAIILRIGLLFVLVTVIDKVKATLFSIDTTFISGEFNVHSIIVLVGGAFIIYTAVKEVFHMIAIQHDGEGHIGKGSTKSVGQVITWIVLMNLVFSFDSILSAMALTKVFAVMATAIVIGGILMIWLADRVASFLQKNRMYEVLGLFILLIVGVMLLSEGGHLAHLKFFGHEVHQMTKATFYFVITILVLTDIVQGRYQKKLLAKQDLAAKKPADTTAHV
ncbi:MAG: TerC family protein [Verrucomicrobiales bacterium]|nr:TerC family protein [Verrucomicrobiales bacterium]